MFPNLRTQLPWQNIKEYYQKNIYIKFPSGKCKKIHITGKKIQLQIKNKKYISENMICKNTRCKTNNEIDIFFKNGMNIVFHSNKKQKQKSFLLKFDKTLSDYSNYYQTKMSKINKIPEKYKTSEYLYKKMSEFYGYTIDSTDHGYYPTHKYVHALLYSNDPIDIKLILYYNNIKKPGFVINEYFNEMGTQCYGTYFNHLFIKILNMYVYINLMIINDCFNGSSENHKINNYWFWTSFFSDGDFVDFIPALRIKHFDLKYMFQFNCSNCEEFQDVKMFKNIGTIPKLLKELFRYMFKVKLLKKYCNYDFELISCDRNYCDLYIKQTFK